VGDGGGLVREKGWEGRDGTGVSVGGRELWTKGVVELKDFTEGIFPV
jgi:hypothetical protein